MGVSNIFVREYLESLKEDDELDYLFPILLNSMGFRIVSTPKESKGQSQYGKDIVAIYDNHRYYFELKGYSDKDITDSNYTKKDGIRESIIEAKDTAFNDSSIPKFNKLPIKIVLVHNGVIKANIRPTFDGFISNLFKDSEAEFERWDIFHLTDLFSEYLFNEYLLRDELSLKLFKKSLVLLDVPENDFTDFKKLVDIQINGIGDVKEGRSFNKFFATQNLLASIILHYSRDSDNLESAKNCITYLLLKTWSWVLKNQLEEKKPIQREISKLVGIHYKMLDEFFKKTYSIACLENGLFSEFGAFFEKIAYPVRCHDYLNYLIYYFEVRQYYPNFNREPSLRKRKGLREKQKVALKKIIRNNSGCNRPILDNHSIAIVNVLLFLLKKDDLKNDDLQFIAEYLFQVIDSILIIHAVTNRFPHVGSLESLVKKISKNEKQEDQGIPPSLLITILFEFSAILNFEQLYEELKRRTLNKVNLQTAHANKNGYDIENSIFEKHLDQEFYVETNIELKSSLEEFRKYMKSKSYEEIHFRTDKAGFPYLKILAHIYFENEFLVQNWRTLY